MDAKAVEELVLVNRAELSAVMGRGLVHDLNNALGVVLANVEALLADAGQPERVRQSLEDIRLVTRHAAALTAQLHRLARDGVPGNAALVDLGALVVRSRALLRSALGPSIDLAIATGPDPLVVRSTPGRVEQVLWNLVTNAGQAMPGGGRIEVSVDRAPSGDVCLRVADSGPGIRAEDQAHIFETFFTTRKAQGGTGLGLATVRALVQQDGGRVSFRSSSAEGTTFTVRWPAASESGVVRIGPQLREPTDPADAPVSSRPGA